MVNTNDLINFLDHKTFQHRILLFILVNLTKAKLNKTEIRL